ELGVKEDEVAIILGETSKKQRKEMIAKAKSGEIKILLTSKILDKGISINNANVLFLLYPSKNTATLEQRVGRVSRTCEGKKYAIVYDFIYDHPIFFKQFIKSYKHCIKAKGNFCKNRGTCMSEPNDCDYMLDLEYRKRVYDECTKIMSTVNVLTELLNEYFRSGFIDREIIERYKYNTNDIQNSDIKTKLILEV
uniref:DEAD/DEAH box helicase n=1 Tax=uncultured Cetobacterium sp. TaxID=527638 RepID=UPI00262A2410